MPIGEAKEIRKSEPATTRENTGQFCMNEVITATENLEGVDDRIKQAAISELKREKTFHIMACGLAGAGKSTLLNGLAGARVFAVGHTQPGTHKNIKHTEVKENFTLILCDTPGFDDDSDKEDEYLEAIKEECAHVDTLFYCISVECRIKMKNELKTLKMLRQALNQQIWKRCVIVLTFANSIIHKIEETSGVADPHFVQEEFHERMTDWKNNILRTLDEAGIESVNIPIVFAGIATKRLLFKTDLTPWLSQLWQAVHDISPPDGQAVLFRFSVNRLRPSFVEKDDIPPLPKQDIVVNEKKFEEKLEAKFPTIAKAAVGVQSSAVTKAGLPPFSAKSGVGPVIGGLIGATV